MKMKIRDNLKNNPPRKVADIFLSGAANERESQNTG